MGSDPIINPTARDLSDLGLWSIDDNRHIRVAHSHIADSILPADITSNQPI